MNYSSPNTDANGSNDTDLKDLSSEELIEKVQEYEELTETMRRRHQIELRRGMEAVERVQQTDATHTPTHTHTDGYDVVTAQRVAILIDVQNMYYAARNLYNSKLEFSKLLTTLVRGRVLTRAIAYIVERPGMEQEKFVEVLRRNGYEVRKKILIERSDGSQKGDWDLGIALDAVALSDKVDSVVLVTGDGDFVSLVQFLHHRGVRVEVASFPETTALELIRSCNYYHRLNERVLLPGGEFQAPTPAAETEDDGFDEPPAPRPQRTSRPNSPPAVPSRSSSSGSGPRPGRSPIDDMELDDDDDDDDDFSL